MNVTSAIQAFINDELLGSTHSVGLDEDLLESGLLDSIGVIRLVGFVEKQFGFKVPPQDLTIENFETVNTIKKYLSEHFKETE